MWASARHGGRHPPEGLKRLFPAARGVLRKTRARPRPLGDDGPKPLLTEDLDAAAARGELGRRGVTRIPQKERGPAEPGRIRRRPRVERPADRPDSRKRASGLARGHPEYLGPAPPDSHEKNGKLLVSGLCPGEGDGRVDCLLGTVGRSPAEAPLRRAPGAAGRRHEQVMRKRDVGERAAHGERIRLLVVEKEENGERFLFRQQEDALFHDGGVPRGAVLRGTRHDRGEPWLAAERSEVGILLKRDAVVETRGNRLVEPRERVIGAARAGVETGEVVGRRGKLAARPRLLEEGAGTIELVRVHGGEAETFELEGVGHPALENAHVLAFHRGAAFRGRAARGDKGPGRRGGRWGAGLGARGERKDDASRKRGENSFHSVDCKAGRS